MACANLMGYCLGLAAVNASKRETKRINVLTTEARLRSCLL